MKPTARRASFAALFGNELSRLVEYSLSPSSPSLYGIGIPGVGSAFWERVRRFSDQAAYAGGWSEAVGRLLELLNPTSFFFKVDWRDDVAQQITIYFRFDRPLAEGDLARAMDRSRPLAWRGASPCALARAMGETAPFIIGLRTAPQGTSVAMYYRIQKSREEAFSRNLPEVTHLLALPEILSDRIRRTLCEVVGLGFPSILGIDSPGETSTATLKVDIAGVLLRDALAFIARHGANEVHAQAFSNFARSLRVEVLSYCGAKFGADGLEGWKLYLPVRPLARIPMGERIRLSDDGRRLRAIPW